MRLTRMMLAASALGLVAAMSAPALADGGYRGGFSGHVVAHGHVHSHGRVGVFIGAPLFWPWYAPPAYYYYPPIVTAPPEPMVYIEKSDEAAGVEPRAQQPPQQQEQRGYWFYCAESKSYYPYVKQCPGGWQRVPAQPPAER